MCDSYGWKNISPGMGCKGNFEPIRVYCLILGRYRRIMHFDEVPFFYIFIRS